MHQVVAVGNARTVGDDQRRAVETFCLLQRFGGLVTVGLHGDLGDVDVAVAHSQQPQILLPGFLAGGRELGHRAHGRGLGLLAAGVGVDLGIHDQDVDVLAGGQDMVEAAVADVIGPAIAPDDPYTLGTQLIGQACQLPHLRPLLVHQPVPQTRNRLPPGRHGGLVKGGAGAGQAIV